MTEPLKNQMLMKKYNLTLLVFLLLLQSFAQKDSAVGLPAASLVFFQVQPVEQVVVLKWSVEPAEELKSFDIERADDGVHFVKIGSKLAISKSPKEEYDFVDATPARNVSLRYRLKLIAKDGFASFSDLRETKMPTDQLAIRLKQNPVRHSVNVEVNSFVAREATLTVVSQAGLPLAAQAVRLSKGITQVSLTTQGLLPGVYRLVVDAGSERKTLSFIKE